MNAAAETSSQGPITGPAEAEQVARRLMQAIEALVPVLEQETELVRTGRVAEASHLQSSKAELSGTYLGEFLRLRASRAELKGSPPGLVSELRRRLERFRALLQINLTVLATAHAVSEGIVRGVSGELARSAAPQTYGPSGRASTPPPRAAQPLAVSRRL